MLTAVRTACAFTGEWADLLKMTAALSMVTTLLLLLLHDWWNERIEYAGGRKRDADGINENDTWVTIAGFDRFRARDRANLFRRQNVRDLGTRVSDFSDDAGRDERATLFAREQFESGLSSDARH